MIAINSNAKISRSGLYVDTLLDDESIVMQIDSGVIFGMGQTAKDIWEYIEKPIEMFEIVERLIADYAVDKQDCTDDVSEFLRYLETADLVVIDEA